MPNSTWPTTATFWWIHRSLLLVTTRHLQIILLHQRQIFPLDWQDCTLKFTSLTYNAKEIRLLLKEDIVIETKWTVEWIMIDPASFTENGEWEIIHRPAKRNTYKHIPMESNKHQDITFYLVIRRKPLFYVVNIIIPCVLISFLASLVYYLPADSGEKMTLSISVLLAHNDAQFNVAYYCNVLVDSTGLCYWLPPAIFRSSCSISRVSSGSSAEYAIDQGLLLRKYSPPGKSDVAGPVTQVVIPIGPGDQVLALLSLPGSPFAAKFSGPYVIKRKISETNYVVSTPARKRATQLCHVNLLKPYYTSSNASGGAKAVALAGGGAPSLQVAGGDDGVGPDDAVLLGSETWDDHIARTRALFERLASANLTLNLAKCEFAKATVTYLGKIMGQGAVRPVSAKLFLQRLPHILRMSRPAEAEPYWDGALPWRSSSVGYIASAEEYDSVKSRSELMFEKQSGRHGLEKDNWSGIARTVDRLCLFLVTPVMTFGTVIIFLRGICNQPPHLPFKGAPHDSREENPRLL
ncbi:Acetylcholine receptor subunit delta [Takifugu flavidus]|uniref:Acetylcholine receptor subunit delta n=1 Tax=Takifugu flavidus TaxID=433684 RepID=A0A5C6MHU9_9TELE|nr:Acetylcholine receptor subunit delta [Takifugu flavidus]